MPKKRKSTQSRGRNRLAQTENDSEFHCEDLENLNALVWSDRIREAFQISMKEKKKIKVPVK